VLEKRPFSDSQLRDSLKFRSLPNPEFRGSQEDTVSSSATADRRTSLQVLVVDEDPSIRNACAEIASSMGYTTVVAESTAAAHTVLLRQSIDLLLLDPKASGGNVLPLLEELRSRYPEMVIIIMSASATVNSAVDAMRIGAGDYLAKPFSIEELTTVLERSAQHRAFNRESRELRDKLRTGIGMGMLVGRAPAMEKLYRILSKVSSSSHPVLILGESGTGKELVARSIHANGPNANKPFIAVDCGSLVPTLIESELFGYAKGAFPGAIRAREGLLATAGGGTVFLDEISELPLDLQTKLLRALQEKEIHPAGSTHAVPISARVLAATNRDLTLMVASGRFRKDLYFRLNVVNIRIPPLRERKSDIPLLAAHILDRIRRDNGLAFTFSDDALRLTAEYDWPGNVRELEHAIERACALSSGPVLHMADFPTQLQDHQKHLEEQQTAMQTAAISDEAPQHGVTSIAALEKMAILSTIRKLNGDKLMAARLLGIGKTTLYRKLKEYGIGDTP
jgi:DNA-binding NtrC family response regulator